MALAIQEMYPKVKFGMGPAIENGFYYDFDFSSPISPEDLPKIEKKMKELIKQNIKFEKKIISKTEAKKILKNQLYKLELIEDLPDKTVSLYQSGKFTDLCKGPHVKTTLQLRSGQAKEIIDSFKLTKIAGAYWRGSEKNPMLTRIYGIAFKTREELADYFKIVEEAEKRDHRKLGKKLELFFFHQTSPGMPYWLPKGVVVLNELINFWREEHKKRGYQEIVTPLLNKKELYETSGHWEHFREEMFIVKTEEEETYGIKAMNCANAMIVFGRKPRSYKELPLRLSDTDTLHRFERSGTLYGLFRVREFRQDDAHIFLAEEQIKSEYKAIFEIVKRFYSVFNLKYSFRLGTRPEKFMGDKKSWDRAEKALKEILKESGEEYTILEGDGAFYGPKIDILMKDSIGREWQTGTIQLDFQMPKNFDLKYADAKGRKKTPVVIHRVIYGSLERFIGILIEHYAGALPLWLSPEQVWVIPVGSTHRKYASEIAEKLTSEGFRVEAKTEAETVSKKIREGEIQKIPYLLIVGDREMKKKNVRVRKRGKGDVGEVSLTKFLKEAKIEIVNKS